MAGGENSPPCRKGLTMMYGIRGIRPVILSPEQLSTFAFIPIAVAAGFLAYAALRRTPKYKKGEKINVIAVTAAALVSLVMYFLFGTTVTLLKCVLLTTVFLFASFSDIQERSVPDWVSIVIALTWLISVSGSKLLWNAVAGITAFGFFFLAAILSKNKIGGADVKFIAACMFVCGVSEGIAGLILGLMLSVIGTLIRNKKTKSKDKSLPMIPYLSVGFLTAYMIGGLIT